MLEKREFLVNTEKCFWKTQKTNLEILNLKKHLKSYKYKSLIYMKKKKEPEVIRTVPVFLGESWKNVTERERESFRERKF